MNEIASREGKIDMTTKTSTAHAWINSIVAVVALLVSGTSAFLTWQGKQAKKEALATTVRPTGACRTEFWGGEAGGSIGLCWSVILANESETRLSVVSYRVLGVEERGFFEIGGFQNLEAPNGSPLALPIILDGGEAREIIVRVRVNIPPSVSRIIAQMPEYQGRTLTSLPISALQRKLATAKTDFIGNIVEPMIVDGEMHGFSMSSPIKISNNLLTLKTGRGTIFNVHLTYPPGMERK